MLKVFCFSKPSRKEGGKEMTDLRDEMSKTKKMAIIAIFGAMAGVLMCIEFPLTFIAPDFYKIDLGDIPAIIGSFMLGPVAGVIIEAIKILIKLNYKYELNLINYIISIYKKEL